MQLTSPAFSDGGKIPVHFTCDGANRSPPLLWLGVPPETKSLALICKDPDAPGGIWYHWAAYDIGPDHGGLEENCAPRRLDLVQAINDFGHLGYGGPCPPRGRGGHRYRFTLYAADVAHLPLPSAPDCRSVEAALPAHSLARAELVGIYER